MAEDPQNHSALQQQPIPLTGKVGKANDTIHETFNEQSSMPMNEFESQPTHTKSLLQSKSGKLSRIFTFHSLGTYYSKNAK